MKKLLLFLLLAVPLFGEEYKGNLPKEIKLTYDRLEDRNIFKNEKLPHTLWLSISQEKGEDYRLFASVGRQANFSSYLDKVIIYVENDSKIESFTLDNFDNAQYDWQNLSSTKVERLYATTYDFTEFLKSTIRANSQVTVRLYHRQYEELKLNKKDIDRLVEMLELQKALQSTLKK